MWVHLRVYTYARTQSHAHIPTYRYAKSHRERQ